MCKRKNQIHIMIERSELVNPEPRMHRSYISNPVSHHVLFFSPVSHAPGSVPQVPRGEQQSSVASPVQVVQLFHRSLRRLRDRTIKQVYAANLPSSHNIARVHPTISSPSVVKLKRMFRFSYFLWYGFCSCVHESWPPGRSAIRREDLDGPMDRQQAGTAPVTPLYHCSHSVPC